MGLIYSVAIVIGLTFLAFIFSQEKEISEEKTVIRYRTSVCKVMGKDKDGFTVWDCRGPGQFDGLEKSI